MGNFTNIFQRMEVKYLITRSQQRTLLEKIGEHMEPDRFGKSVINNIYFDTPDYRLIRESIEKPVYKEKLRLRCYGHVTDEITAFVELKKKFSGTVYKRRISMQYSEATDYLCRGKPAVQESQISREIDYVVSFYGGLMPVVDLFYDRSAYVAKDGSDLRITFDRDVRFRTEELDLRRGSDGIILTGGDVTLMEIKSVNPMPLWLVAALDELKILPSSFSKYGNAYLDIMKGRLKYISMEA